ncbi:Tn3 family transposase [Streptomyces sp. NPDC058092]|uniref:Tn3 family transposase n=1 Tax=Streptomyces sp. NPDC058092 TaxID=3346336 RepID=UPI0036E13D82
MRYWGDGLRFVVPVRNISSAPSPKCFGFKRGIIRLNAVNDRVAGIGQMAVPGTPRDSLHILDALNILDALMNGGGVKPEMPATGNASYSTSCSASSRSWATRSAPGSKIWTRRRFWRATMPDISPGPSAYGVVVAGPARRSEC